VIPEGATWFNADRDRSPDVEEKHHRQERIFTKKTV